MAKNNKHDPAMDAMMLIDYARNPRPSVIAKKYGVHHSYVQRLWKGLSEDERHAYQMKAEDVRDIAAEKIIEAEAEAITEITSEMVELTRLSLKEYGRRLRSNILKEEIKDRDLIAFVSKAITIIQDSTKPTDPIEGDKSKLPPTFNIFSQSISEHININSNTYDYDE